MSVQTLSPAADGFDDRGLAAFLAQVPAARDYDLAEFDARPCKLHRRARGEANRRAIDDSRREGR